MAVGQDDILRVVAQFRAAQTSTRVQGVYHFKVNTFVMGPDSDVANDFKTFMEALYLTIAGLQSTTTVGEFVKVTNLTQRERVGQLGLTYAGTVPGGEILPPQCAAEVLVSLKKLRSTARKYIGPLAETIQADGILTAAAVANLTDFLAMYITNFNGAITGNTYEPVTVKTAGTVIQNVNTFDDSTGRIVDIVHTQRRRTQGVGLT